MGKLSDVVLVGHSYGGMVITGVADALPDRIRSLVYLDAFVPKNGEALVNFLPEGSPPPQVVNEYCLAPLPGAFFGATPEVAALVDAGTTPMPIACFTQPLKLSGAIDRVKQKTYVYCNVPAPTTFTQFYDKSQRRSRLDGAHAAVHAYRSDRNAERTDRVARASCLERRFPGDIGLAHGAVVAQRHQHEQLVFEAARHFHAMRHGRRRAGIEHHEIGESAGHDGADFAVEARAPRRCRASSDRRRRAPAGSGPANCITL